MAVKKTEEEQEDVRIPSDAAEYLGKAPAGSTEPVTLDLPGGETIDLSQPAPDPFGEDEPEGE